jgi:hypothetical protein
LLLLSAAAHAEPSHAAAAADLPPLPAYPGDLVGQGHPQPGSAAPTEPAVTPTTASAPVHAVAAARRVGTIDVDGRLSEAAWQSATPAGSFWQRAPHEGAPLAFATEFRVLYDDEALYVGVRAFDSDPARIRGLLTRRDEESPSDWILVGLDTYRDRRTAFVFALNPAGVQRDFMLFDDVEDDDSWNAVWAGAAAVDADGWVAEFRIPYNQLRFAAAAEQEWGMQVGRTVHRTQERSFWAPVPTAKPQMVSLFGRVHGIRQIEPALRLEVVPYTVGGARFAEVDAGDPFHDSVSPVGDLGVDFLYGLSGNFTLSGTLNPDFGQVEADPSQVNLTAQETYFEEKRPVFLEGAEIFGFSLTGGDGDMDSEQLFYSRRIGAPPHASGLDVGTFAREDPTTRIYAAAKLSGKTAGGWSLGALSAVTAEEMARVQGEDGERFDHVIEPLAHYGVLRLRKDANAGRTNVGLAFTSVHRRLDGTGLDWLHDDAYAGGLQLDHRFAGDDWALGARLLASRVHGAPAALDLTQRASRRYFQRPDADHLDYDPSRTSLSGVAATASVTRIGGEHWRGGTGVNARSPGFEVNDLGFQRDADYVINWLWGSYRDEHPGAVLRRFQINVNPWTHANFAPELTTFGANLNANLVLLNYWGSHVGTSVNRNRLDTHLLRGGPAVRGHDNYNVFANLWTDSRRSVRGNLGGHAYVAPTKGSWSAELDGDVSFEAGSNLAVSAGPFVERRVNDTQYVDEVSDAMGAPHYVLGRIDQTTLGLTVRVDYTLSPRLSLQAYAQPFLSAGAYTEYKEAADLRADDYADRFHIFAADEITAMDGDFAVDRDGDGTADFRFAAPDFNVRELSTNLVMRWEYRPGSTLFLIWSHGRQSFAPQGEFRPGTDLGELVDTAGEHVLLMKLTYWWGA